MKSRTRLTIAVAALAMHVLTPFGVYAAAPATSGLGEVCSVYSKARANDPASAPSPSRSHATAHCALCTGASSSAAMPAPTRVAVNVPALLGIALDDTRMVVTNARSLSPPSRGPPLADLPQ